MLQSRALRQLLLLPPLAVGILACEARPATPARGTAVQPKPAQAASRPDSFAVVLRRLRTLRGSFVPGPDSTWRFTPDAALFSQIVEFGNSAVAPLVNCLDDTTRAEATIGESRVFMGVMCYEALRRIVYYEPWDEESGTYTGTWEGFLPPTATPSDLVRAKRAWEIVVRDRLYHVA